MRYLVMLAVLLAALTTGAPSHAQDRWALFQTAQASPPGSPAWISGMERAHRAGHPGASFYLAQYYYDQYDYARMKPWLDEVKAAGVLGCYYWQMRMPISSTQQRVAILRAQAPECPGHAYALGHAYQDGEEGLPRDFGQAERYYRMAIAHPKSGVTCPEGVAAPCPTKNIRIWAQQNMDRLWASASPSTPPDYYQGRSGRTCHRSEDC